MKRELLISFVMSQIDDKTVRLDMKRPNVGYIFDDITTLANKVLQLFHSKRFFNQNVKLLLKLIQY